MHRAVWDLAHTTGSTVAAVELEFLGTLMVCPTLRLSRKVEELKPEHFSAPYLGETFRSIMALKHPEAVLVAHNLESRGIKPPQGSYGWGAVLSAMLDDTLVEDDAVDIAASTIREEAIKRSVAARIGARK